MPSSSPVARVRAWLTAQQQIATLAAILLAIPAAYAFHTTFGGTAGDFLLLMTLGVGVPMAYEEYWPRYDRTWQAVAWVLAACAVVIVEFVGLYLLATRVLLLDDFLAAAGAFLVTDLGNLALLAARQRA